MKSLAELQAIKAKMQNKVALREGSGEMRIVVGMARNGFRGCSSNMGMFLLTRPSS